MVNGIFCSDKKIGAIFGPFFGPKFGHFGSKIRFSDIFFETAHQICLKLGQKLETNGLNHRMTVLCLRKFLFWPFWPFLGQKYITCDAIYMVLGCFCLFSSKPLMFLVIFWEELERMISKVENADARAQHAESWKLINQISGRKAPKQGILKGNSSKERVDSLQTFQWVTG